MDTLFKADQVAVILEGIGGSGKSTIARMIVRSLRESGLNVCSLTLPAYQTPTGVLLGELLSDRMQIPSGEATQLLFAANRAEISQALERGLLSHSERKWSFVVERWVSSNALSSIPIEKYDWKGVVSEWLDLYANDREEFLDPVKKNFEWMSQIDRNFLSLFGKIPLIKIFLEVDPQRAFSDRGQRESGQLTHDVFEAHRKRNWLSNILLTEYAKWERDWVFVRRQDRTPEEVHRFCMEAVVSEVKVNRERVQAVFVEGAPTKGDFVDFNRHVLPRIYRPEDLERIKEALRESEFWRERELDSQAWAGMDPQYPKRNPESDFIG